MVLLRKSKDGSAFYQDLHCSFHFIDKDVVTSEKWEQVTANRSIGPNCYAIIIYNDGQEVEYLYSTQDNFLLNPDGSTFKDVSQIPSA